MNTNLTIAPILFHWSAEEKREFYFKIADESPIKTVYLGEVICSKRAPFFDKYYDEVIQRLQKGGKNIVFSSLAEVMIPRERKMTEGLCELTDFEVEANDASALYFLKGKKHRVGQYFNTYNENTMDYLSKNGATHFTLPSELPKNTLKILGKKATELNVGIEVQIYGRTSLALSARCYHARSHGRTKDSCQFVCEQDPDGMSLKTLDNKSFLAINGVQTLSETYLNLIQELPEMKKFGINHFRLSPHTTDMIHISKIFHSVLNKKISTIEGLSKLREISPEHNIFSNGFFHKEKGHTWIEPYKNSF